jgi:hypothetical protein
MEDVTYRWIDGPTATDEEWDLVESILATRGWMSLNRMTTSIRVALDKEGHLLGFHVIQLVPSAGPLWVKPSMRATGIAEHLADDMFELFVQAHARGWMVVADNPSAAKLCEARGMHKLESPVFTTEVLGGGSSEAS